jgi:hypothetical protein
MMNDSNSRDGDSLSKLYREFEDNFSWLCEAAKPPIDNRFRTVLEILSEASSKYDEASRRMTSDFDENPLFMAGYEAFRFNEVVEYLRTIDRSRLPIKKIRAMCKGPTYHHEEIPEIGNSEGRDIQFELILAAHLSYSGFKVTNHDDVQLEYANNVINYECKRPASIKNYKARFDEALNQLELKIGNRENQFGIISFSIEKMNNLHTKMFRGNDIDGVIQVTARMRDEIFKHMRGNLKIASQRNIIGFHLWVNTLIWDKDRGRFTPINVHFTERTQPEKKTEMHDFLLDEIKNVLAENLKNRN